MNAYLQDALISNAPMGPMELIGGFPKRSFSGNRA